MFQEKSQSNEGLFFFLLLGYNKNVVKKRGENTWPKERIKNNGIKRPKNKNILMKEKREQRWWFQKSMKTK